jgi:hypothetical protein
VEAGLRAFALAQLPWEDRRRTEIAVLDDPTEDGEMSAYAFELLVRDRHPELEARARALLAECGRAPAGGGDSQTRHLYLSALRALIELRKVTAADLLPLMQHPRADRASRDSLAEEVVEIVRGLVAARAAGGNRGEVREGVDALLELLEQRGHVAHLQGRTLEDVREYLVEQIEGVAARSSDVVYHRMVVEAVMEFLFHRLTAISTVQGGGVLEVAVTLEPEILMALGRTRAPEAVAALIEFLQGRDNGYRPYAALALGMAGDPRAAVHLVPLLLAEDGFTRFCAYESLRHLTGEDHFADWMYGEQRDHARAAEEYGRWCREPR